MRHLALLTGFVLGLASFVSASETEPDPEGGLFGTIPDNHELTLEEARTWRITKRTQGFRNLLHISLMQNHPDIALEILKRQGAKELLFVQDLEDFTPVEMAVYFNKARVLDEMLKMISREEFVKLLELSRHRGGRVGRSLEDSPGRTDLFRQNFKKIAEALAPVSTHFFNHKLTRAEFAKAKEAREHELDQATQITELLFQKAGEEIMNKYKVNESMAELTPAPEKEDDE